MLMKRVRKARFLNKDVKEEKRRTRRKGKRIVFIGRISIYSVIIFVLEFELKKRDDLPILCIMMMCMLSFAFHFPMNHDLHCIQVLKATLF